MIRVQFSNGSSHRVEVPYKHQKQSLINLAQAFVAKENSLPPENRTRFTATIEATLAEALTAQAATAEQEAGRKSASEALKRTDATARVIIRQIRSLMAGRFAQAPEQAQAWGFFVRQSGRGAGNILTPRGRDEILTCLNQYITTEEARPIGEQFTQPPLDAVITLRNALSQQWQQRQQARQERMTYHADLENACQTLAKELRLALTALLLNNFQGEPERALGRWGFQLVARSPRPQRDEARLPAPEPEAILEPA